MNTSVEPLVEPAALAAARDAARAAGTPFAGAVPPAAATAATQAGFAQVFNVLEGFEGELDAHGQRGHADGWRFRGLPWLQD